MPLCARCGKDWVCGCAAQPAPVGTVVAPCATRDGALWIHVVDDQGRNIKEIICKKNDGDPVPSDEGGLVRYDPLPAGVYKASLGDLTSGIAKEYEMPQVRERSVHVAQGQITYAGFELRRKAKLVVRVEKVGDASAVFDDADVEVIEGPDNPPKGKTAAGALQYFNTFGKVCGGVYKFKATLSAEDGKKYATVKDFTTDAHEKSVSPGGDETALIEVEPRNLLQPRIDAEYKVVLLDRGLAAHQDKPGEKPLHPDPTRIEIVLNEKDASAPDQPYPGSHHGGAAGVLTCAPANIAIFLDEDCTQPLPPGGDLTPDQLKPGTTLKLYLRGTTAGKCRLKLQLKPPGDRFLVAADQPAELEIGVAELKLTIHQYVKADFDSKKVDPWVPPPAGKNYNPLSPGNNSADYHKDWLAHYHKRMKDLVLPDQRPMTEHEKIAGKGRLLSASPAGGSSRAKLIVHALNAAEWPDVPADYAIYLNRTNLSGGVRVYDAETDGNLLNFPVGAGLKVSELKMAEKVFWIEGLQATSRPADTQLDLALDRDEGGLAKEVKRNGDAARVTVVSVQSVKLDFTPVAGQPLRWDVATGRAYVNLLAGDNGRKFTFGAQLSEQVAGVTVHFSLCPDPKNQTAANSTLDLPKGGEIKWDSSIPLFLSGADVGAFEIRNNRELYLRDGILSIARKSSYSVIVHATYTDGNVSQIGFRKGSADGTDTTAGILVRTYTPAHFPPTREQLWKWDEMAAPVKSRDKANADDFFHISAVTDAKGYAKVDLWTSRFGGDIFTPSCYIDQDPRMALYVEGHADLGKHKPFQGEQKVTVWRRSWIQKVAVEGIITPDLAGAMGQYEPVRAEVVRHADLALTKTTVNGYNPRALYPRYMIQVNGGAADALVVSDTNKNQFFTTFAAAADKPNMIPILVCDAQWDPDGNSSAVTTPPRRTNAFPLTVETDINQDGFGVLNPPLQPGTLVVSGMCKAQEWDDALNGGAGDWGPERSQALTATDLDIDPNRTSLSQVRVQIPAGLNPTNASRIWIENLIVRKAGIYLGESFMRRILAVYDPAEPADFQNTIAHEVGHAYSQVMYPTTPSVHNRAVLPRAQTNLLNIPPHPNSKDEQQGNHCRHLTNKCVMYDSGPTAGSLNHFCNICRPYLLVLDMSAIT